jgi:hypothetical protein
MRLFALPILFLLSAPVFAQTGTSWMRTNKLNALNPQISVIPDFLWTTGPESADSGANLREVELSLQADVDTYGRADIYLGVPTSHGGTVEVEEAFFTLTKLPWRLQARGGRFFAGFGRLNMMHRHEFDFADKPLALTRFHGEHGVQANGAEVSWVGGLGPLFFEQTFALSNDLGEEEEEVTTTVNTTGANPVTVKVEEDEASHRRFRDLAKIARSRVYGDISDSANVELGLSGALHQPSHAEARRLGAIDATFRWRPDGASLEKSLLWRSAFHYSHRELRPEENVNTGAITENAADTDRRGFYSYVTYQPFKRWRAGFLFDYAESPTDRVARSPQWRYTPAITFYATEFQRFRTQYQYRQLATGRHEHRGTFQWTLVLGPHGAHPY